MLNEQAWAKEYMKRSAYGSGLDVLDFIVGERPVECEGFRIVVEYDLPNGDTIQRGVTTKQEETWPQLQL